METKNISYRIYYWKVNDRIYVQIEKLINGIPKFAEMFSIKDEEELKYYENKYNTKAIKT